MNTAVLIPCYKVKNKILSIVKNSLKIFNLIIIIDDYCPENSGKYIEEKINNKKIKILYKKYNSGVGGAIKTGLKFLKNKKFDIVTKLDGDGQIKPSDAYKISLLLFNSKKDYAIGNRFGFNIHKKKIPFFRWYLNRLISFFGKLCLGKYEINDFLNGLICFKKKTLNKINFNKVRNDFFFESDLIYQIKIKNLKVINMPIKIKYFKKNSNFKPVKEFNKFFWLFIYRFFQRTIIGYFNKGFFLSTLIIIIFFIYNFYSIFFFNNHEVYFAINIFLFLSFFILDFYSNKHDN